MLPTQRSRSTDAEHRPGVYVVRVEGDLDLESCPGFEATLAEAELTQADRIVVDLEGLKFIDSAGLGALLRASRRSASNGNRLEMTLGSGQPAELFRMTGLDKLLPFTDPSLCPTIRVTGGVAA